MENTVYKMIIVAHIDFITMLIIVHILLDENHFQRHTIANYESSKN
jgi:hypothetical protein